MKLKQAKKRNKKVKIPDIAIEKVPLIIYKEIPKEENVIIQNLAKKVLTLSKEENDSNEVSIIYKIGVGNANDDLISVSFGTEHEVNPLDNSKAIKLLKGTDDCILILLHNHPSLSKFSLIDIHFFLSCYQLKMIVVVSNNGSISYLVKQKKYNIDKAFSLLDESLNIENKNKSFKSMKKAADNFMRKCKIAGLYYSER